MWQNWVNALLGIVLIAVAFLGLTGAALGWTLGVIGLVIAIIGFWGATALSASSTTESSVRHV